MASTYVTFTKVCKFHNIPDSDWTLNGKYNYIEFKNGSRIDLLDLAFRPSDPLYERLGSLEYTDGWIEEAGEVHFMAVDILRSRVGRHLNQELDIAPKSLYTFNPNKGWVYRIYKQWQAGLLPDDCVFIHALFSDNPWTADVYGKQLLRIQDKSMRERLMKGSFEYDNDPACLIDSDAIVDLWTNTVDDSNERYMIMDIARHGVDKTVIFLFKGMRLYGVYIYQKQGTDITAEKAKIIAEEQRIPYSHIMGDEDGIGGGVIDQMKGIRGFIGNSTARDNPETKEKENFGNHRSQCYYKLAEVVNNHEMAIDLEIFHSEVNGITEEVFKDMLCEELENVKSKNADKDTARRVTSKDEIKEDIARSPDFSDTAMMRMSFLYPQKSAPSKVTIYKPTFGAYNKR